MTMTTVFELISILSLLALTVILYFSGETKRSPFDTQAETMWTMRARRVGPAKWRLCSFFARGSSEKIRLEEGTLIVGNRLRDECYIDDTGERVRLQKRIMCSRRKEVRSKLAVQRDSMDKWIWEVVWQNRVMVISSRFCRVLTKSRYWRR